MILSPCLLQIDQLKQELSKKESELLGLQTKLETLNNQNSDCKQHIEVLKESLTAKEQRAAILQTEVRLYVLYIHTHILQTEVRPHTLYTNILYTHTHTHTSTEVRPYTLYTRTCTHTDTVVSQSTLSEIMVGKVPKKVQMLVVHKIVLLARYNVFISTFFAW